MSRQFLTVRRMRTYPSLMLVGAWGIQAINLALHRGWMGGFGQVLGIDFVIFYAAGLLYRTDASLLYDFPAQLGLERSLLAPTPLAGSGPFSNPPFTALAFSALTHLPPAWALACWSLLNLACLIAAVALLARRLLLTEALRSHLSPGRLLVLVLSFFPLVEGFFAGQPVGLMLLAVTGVCIATLKGRWALAGLSASLLLYKPQYAAGYLILWAAWGAWPAILSFLLASAAWIGSVLLFNGAGPFLAFANVTGQLLHLPYREGWPAYLLVTPYGLLASLLPERLAPSILAFTEALALALAGGLAWIAYRGRRLSPAGQSGLLALAVLYPLLASPYALLHDAVVLVPFFLLAAGQAAAQGRRSLLYAAAATYAGSFVLPIAGYALGFPLPAAVPVALLALEIVMLTRPAMPIHLQPERSIA